MPLKFRLRLTRKGELSLSYTEFWTAEESKSVQPTVTAVSSDIHEQTRLDEPVFFSTAGPRALGVFLLRAHAQRHPVEFPFEGGPQSLPQTLAEALRDKRTNDGQKTWIQGMFTKADDAQPWRSVSSLFRYRYNYRDGYFFVGLGEIWKGADFKVLIDSKEVAPRDYELYAGQLGDKTPHWEPTPAKLDGVVTLFVCDSRAAQEVPILDYGLPLPTDAKLIVRVRLSEPRFAYLVWITSTGQVQPIYPWVDFQWDTRISYGQVTNLCLPPPDSDGNTRCYPINTGAGLETVFLLARGEPLPKSFDSILARVFQSLSIRAAKRVSWQSNSLHHFNYSQDATNSSRTTRLGSPQTLNNPLAGFKTAISSALGSEFPLIKAWAFANAGTTSRRSV